MASCDYLVKRMNWLDLIYLDAFWTMPRKEAQATLDIYNLFVRETEALISLFTLGRTFVSNLPQIQPAESGIIEQMEKYVNSLPRTNGKAPDVRFPSSY